MAKEKSMINDLTQGGVTKRLIIFTLPLMLANALQTCYNLVDMFFVGQFAGTNALSAVSISGQLTAMMFFIYMGISTGGQIYIAQSVGAGRRDKLNEIIGNIITISFIAGIVTMVSIPLAKPIFRLLQTPEEIIDETVTYLVISALFNVVVAVYNGLCGVLRGMGDSTRPTIFVAIASVINIGLDYLFVAVFHWGTAGAAWATVIGQTFAAACAVVYLYRHKVAFGFDFKLPSLKLSSEHTKIIFKLAAPVSAQSIFISLSMMVVSARINAYGVAAVAVVGICNKLHTLCNVLTASMSSSTASFVGQNIGAGKIDRVRKTVVSAVAMCAVYGIILCALFVLFPIQISGLFTSDAEVLALAPAFMRCCVISIMAASLMSPLQGLINGVGFTLLNMIIAVCDGVIGRISLALGFGYALNIGALGFYFGSALAGLISVIGGSIYFFGGWWKNRAVLGKE